MKKVRGVKKSMDITSKHKNKKPPITTDRIKVAVRIRPPLFKEIHEEKAIFEIDNVRYF
jgi:hypothetical protein